MEIKNLELIKEKLNIATKLNFMENYNKSDIEMILNNNESEELKQVKKEIKDILCKQFDENDYRINVADNYVQIEKIISKDEFSMSCQVVDTIWSSNFKKLPYQWVMGRKVSKKCMEETLQILN